MIEAKNQENKMSLIFFMKENNYATKIMPSFMTRDELEGAKLRRDIMDISDKNHTKLFTYQNPFVINFKYIHKLEYNNNWIQTKFSLDRTRASNF